MRKLVVFGALALTVLAGCSGGSGGPSIDRGAVIGTGAISDPYIMPSEMPSNTNGGMEDYIARMGGDWWLFIPDAAKKNTIGSSATTLAIMMYDPKNDQWGLVYSLVGGADSGGIFLAKNSATGLYSCDPAVTTCLYSDVDFALLDQSPNQSQYGTFAYAHYDDGAGNALFQYLTTGLKTQASAMPTTGTASYSGDFEVTLTQLSTGYYWRSSGGKIAVDADFGGNSLVFNTATAAVFNGGGTPFPATDQYTVSGSATITGNTFTSVAFGGEQYAGDGTLLGSYTGTLDGAFYGPSANELAGAFQQYNPSNADFVVTGGLWAAK